MKWLDSLGPFGQGFAQPLFCFKNLKVSAVQILKGAHLKLKLNDPASGKTSDAIYFSPPVELAARLQEIAAQGGTIHLLGELQWNYFAGKKTVQLLIKDIQFV